MKQFKNYCKHCGYSGWMYGSELKNASQDTYNDTMTKYTCDMCKASDIINKWTWIWLQYDCDMQKAINNMSDIGY